MLGRALHVKRSEHGRFGRAPRCPMVDGIDQHGDAERIRQQDEFLPLVVAYMSGTGQEIDAGFPFRLRRFDLPDEGMQMAHQRLADLPDAVVLRGPDTPQNGVRDGGFVKVAHLNVLFRSSRWWFAVRLRARPARSIRGWPLARFR